MDEKTQIDIGGASPCLIVRDVRETLAFYRDSLGFEVTYEGPEPDDLFFAILQRGGAMLMFKSVGVEPVANYTRDVGKGEISVPDPDTLAAEFASRNVTFSKSLSDTHDGLRGFEIEDVNGYLLFFGWPKE
jgi:catechol 2,3-dioxygenase-like lactoylglutathione lyase family enzyme